MIAPYSVIALALAACPGLAIPPPEFGFVDSGNHTELSVAFTFDGNTTVVQEGQLFGGNSKFSSRRRLLPHSTKPLTHSFSHQPTAGTGRKPGRLPVHRRLQRQLCHPHGRPGCALTRQPDQAFHPPLAGRKRDPNYRGAGASHGSARTHEQHPSACPVPAPGTSIQLQRPPLHHLRLRAARQLRHPGVFLRL